MAKQRGLKIINVDKLVCDNCKPTEGFYPGTYCPKCNKPFRIMNKGLHPVGR